MSDNGKRLKELASEIIAKLKAAGFKLQYYEAMSTNSIYIKLDYGVCNSIRISDHPGYKHLQYRYNLILGCRSAYTARSPQGWPRYFYPAKRVDELIKSIKAHKENRVKRFGPDWYEAEMEDSKTRNAGAMGFWSKSIEL